MQQITDTHTHILPNMDDGASSAALAAEMLSSLKKQGVTRVLLTPHYYPYKEQPRQFIERRSQALQSLQAQSLPAEIKLILAAEVHQHEALFNLGDLSPLKIQQSEYMLLELSSRSAESCDIRDILKLIYDHNITPLLAHIERYPALIKNKKVLEELINEGCKLQMTLGAWHTGNPLYRWRLRDLLKSGYIHTLGTDCHNLSSRPPKYACYLEELTKMLGKDAALKLAGGDVIFKHK